MGWNDDFFLFTIVCFVVKSDWTDQVFAGFRNSADVHGLSVDGIEEASFCHGDGADNMDPPDDKAHNDVTNKTIFMS